MRRLLVVAAVALASAFPARAEADSVFLVQGGGWGHGVGMSQWGAEGAAIHGWSYQRILAHFYPATTLQLWPAKPVRVLLAESEARVAIGSAAPFLVIDARGRKLHVKPRTLSLGTPLRLGGRALVPPLRFVPGAQPLTLGGAGYRGELLVRRSAGTLAVVNRVRLDLYLRGVVPYEMPTGWHAAAYEAQAVVSRTYAFATMHPGAEYDLFADDRSQVYGGIAAERRETSLALGATAGRVLTYDGRPIVAYYHSSSGGRTEAVEDAWPGHRPEPYLVSVTDPFDSVSPHHRWDMLLQPDALSKRFHVAVTDLRVEHDATGHAEHVLLVGPHGTKRIDAPAFRRALGLRSTHFAVQVLSLDPPLDAATYGRPLALRGFARGVAGVVLQERTPSGLWQQAARVRAGRNGRFELAVRPHSSTAYRLAVDGQAGSPIEVEVARQIDVRADGATIAGTVVPAAPVRIERRTGGGWRPVAQILVGPSGFFRAELARGGQYRASAGADGNGRYLASASRSVSVTR